MLAGVVCQTGLANGTLLWYNVSLRAGKGPQFARLSSKFFASSRIVLRPAADVSWIAADLFGFVEAAAHWPPQHNRSAVSGARRDGLSSQMEGSWQKTKTRTQNVSGNR